MPMEYQSDAPVLMHRISATAKRSSSACPCEPPGRFTSFIRRRRNTPKPRVAVLRAPWVVMRGVSRNPVRVAHRDVAQICGTPSAFRSHQASAVETNIDIENCTTLTQAVECSMNCPRDSPSQHDEGAVQRGSDNRQATGLLFWRSSHNTGKNRVRRVIRISPHFPIRVSPPVCNGSAGQIEPGPCTFLLMHPDSR